MASLNRSLVTYCNILTLKIQQRQWWFKPSFLSIPEIKSIQLAVFQVSINSQWSPGNEGGRTFQFVVCFFFPKGPQFRPGTLIGIKNTCAKVLQPPSWPVSKKNKWEREIKIFRTQWITSSVYLAELKEKYRISRRQITVAYAHEFCRGRGQLIEANQWNSCPFTLGLWKVPGISDEYYCGL